MNEVLARARPESSNLATTQRVNVFLSHKHRDAIAAKQLASILEGRTGRLKVFLMEEDIQPGTPWGSWIRQALSECQILLLLYLDPSEEWDWCMYEAGMFTPLKSKDRRLVICLHAGEGPPEQLAHLEAVKVVPPMLPLSNESRERAKKANDALIDNFLHRFYCTGELTDGIRLNPNLDREQLAEVALQISQLFAPTETRRDYTAKRITLECPEGVQISEAGIPDEVLVQAEDGKLDVIGVAANHCRWGRVMKAMADEADWIRELAASIAAASQNGLLDPISATFRGANDNKIYRPVLYCMTRTIDRPFRYHVLLCEEPAPGTIGGPGPKGSMFNLLRMANRFRWEIVEKFLEELSRSPSVEERRKIVSQLRASIRLIEQEAKTNQFLMPEVVKAAFRRKEAKDRIDEMFKDWWATRKRIFDAMEEHDDDRPVDDRLIDELTKLRQLNDEFMRLGSRRYHELCEDKGDV